jgi:hypothetical protein
MNELDLVVAVRLASLALFALSLRTLLIHGGLMLRLLRMLAVGYTS